MSGFFAGAGAAGGGTTTIVAPQGRLTLQSGKPVMTADQTAKTTVYYDSYAGNLYPNYNGSSWSMVTITSDEISCGLDAVTPRVASGSVYDIFGTSGAAIGVGPAWTSTTARGTGAGTTELQLLNGIWTNKNSLTNLWGGASGTTNLGPISANQGTYLGSLYATANGQTGMAFSPTAASGGTNNFLALWNAYNRVKYCSICQDNGADYTYATATWRSARASDSNRISFIDGLQQSSIQSLFSTVIGNATGQYRTGVNLDSNSATPVPVASNQLTVGTNIVPYKKTPQLGFHFLQAMEFTNSATSSVFTSVSFQLQLELEM